MTQEDSKSEGVMERYMYTVTLVVLVISNPNAEGGGEDGRAWVFLVAL